MIIYRNNWLIWFILIIVLFSCGPVKRHQRLVKKYPFVHTQDTVIIHDTVRITIPKTRVDTSYQIKELHDTVTIYQDRLKIQMYTVHDSIYVTGECDSITVEKVIEKKVPVVYYEQCSKWYNWIKWLIIGAVLIALIRYVSRIIKPE